VSNLGWGLQMTVLGMGLVFSVLVLLWGLLRFVLYLEDRGAVAADAAASSPAAPAAETEAVAAPGDGMDPDLVAAITAAVVAHRAVRRREAAPAMRTFWPGSLIHASRWVGSGRARQNRSYQRRGR
jgi:sodium pump decarboxylase gamma subunit